MPCGSRWRPCARRRRGRRSPSRSSLPTTPLPVDVDPVRADQIITNVLDERHQVHARGRPRRRDARSATAIRRVVRVTDDGVGIAPDRIGTIFELFAQAENAIGRAQGGMGIGLALVRNLLQLHGGTITAKSDGVGKGSEFAVRFPIATPREAASQPSAATVARSQPSDGQPRRIVIVEDNADVRELLRLQAAAASATRSMPSATALPA